MCAAVAGRAGRCVEELAALLACAGEVEACGVPRGGGVSAAALEGVGLAACGGVLRCGCVVGVCCGADCAHDVYAGEGGVDETACPDTALLDLDAVGGHAVAAELPVCGARGLLRRAEQRLPEEVHKHGPQLLLEPHHAQQRPPHNACRRRRLLVRGEEVGEELRCGGRRRRRRRRRVFAAIIFTTTTTVLLLLLLLLILLLLADSLLLLSGDPVHGHACDAADAHAGELVEDAGCGLVGVNDDVEEAVCSGDLHGGGELLGDVKVLDDRPVDASEAEGAGDGPDGGEALRDVAADRALELPAGAAEVLAGSPCARLCLCCAACGVACGGVEPVALCAEGRRVLLCRVDARLAFWALALLCVALAGALCVGYGAELRGLGLCLCCAGPALCEVSARGPELPGEPRVALLPRRKACGAPLACVEGVDALLALLVLPPRLLLRSALRLEQRCRSAQARLRLSDRPPHVRKLRSSRSRTLGSRSPALLGGPQAQAELGHTRDKRCARCAPGSRGVPQARNLPPGGLEALPRGFERCGGAGLCGVALGSGGGSGLSFSVEALEGCGALAVVAEAEGVLEGAAAAVGLLVGCKLLPLGLELGEALRDVREDLVHLCDAAVGVAHDPQALRSPLVVHTHPSDLKQQRKALAVPHCRKRADPPLLHNKVRVRLREASALKKAHHLPAAQVPPV